MGTSFECLVDRGRVRHARPSLGEARPARTLLVGVLLVALGAACSAPARVATPGGDIRTAPTSPQIPQDAQDAPPQDTPQDTPQAPEGNPSVLPWTLPSYPESPEALGCRGRCWSDETLESLTLEEKVGQLTMPFLLGDFAPEGSSSRKRARALVEEHGVGGIIVSVGSPTEVAAKLNWLQSLSKLPILVAADLEAGAGFRFDGVVHAPTNIWLGGATRFPALMALGAAGDPELAYEMGRVTALEARAIGVHVPFAPVLDVNNNPANPVINVRSFGEDPQMVALLGEAVARGMQENGAIATGKHFPGHGDTGVDSHIALPVITADRARMDSVELLPFRRAVGAGLGAVMTAHVTVPALFDQSLPATLASPVLTGLLREEIGFRGLIFTDAMDMAAVDRLVGRGEAAVRALEAGADVILMPPDLGAARRAILAAVRSGRLTEERVDESVLRVLRAKEWLGLHLERTVDLLGVAEGVGVTPHLDVARAVADRSITALKDERNLLPLRGTPSAAVYSVTYRRRGDLRGGRAFNAALRRTYRKLRTTYVDQWSDEDDYAEALVRARGMDLVVVSLHVGVRTASGSVALPGEAVAFLRKLASLSVPHIVIAFGNPYLLSEFPEVGTYLAAWSGVPVAERAAAAAIVGDIAVTGTIPTKVAGFGIGAGLQIPKRGDAGR